MNTFDLHAKVRADDGTAWSLALSFRDDDGKLQVVVVGYGDLASGEAGEVRRELASRGLWLATSRGARERFVTALASARVDLRAILVGRAGWHGESQVFATPSFTAEAACRIVVHLCMTIHPASFNMRMMGPGLFPAVSTMRMPSSRTTRA